MLMRPIYRSVIPKDVTITGIQKYRQTMRLPSNVPFLVDNLWEWKRPEEFPNRRFSVFASPDPLLAKDLGPKNGSVFQVEMAGRFKMCQLKNFSDSKFHPECKSLPKILLDCLDQKWIDADLPEKVEIGRLWIPGLKKGEIENLFDTVDGLKSIRNKLSVSIKYWSDAVLSTGNPPIVNGSGEIFFEAFDGYYLRKTS
jgi:hypothetical protein